MGCDIPGARDLPDDCVQVPECPKLDTQLMFVDNGVVNKLGVKVT